MFYSRVKQRHKMCSYLVLEGDICLNTHTIYISKYIIIILNKLEKYVISHNVVLKLICE